MSFQTTPVLVINLARRPDRWAKITARLSAVGLSSQIQRIDAVDGQLLTPTQLGQISTSEALMTLKRPREQHEELGSVGAIGCYLSHLKVWQHIMDSQQPALIVEDDAVFHPSLRTELQTPFLQDACRPFDLVLLGYSVLRQPLGPLTAPASPLRQFQGMFFGLQFYYLTPRGAQRLLQHALPITIQVDSYMGQQLVQGIIHCAVHARNLAGQEGRDTDIQTVCRGCDRPTRAKWNWLLAFGLVLIVLVTWLHFRAPHA